MNRHWIVLKNIPLEALAPTIEGMQLAKGTEYTSEALILAVRQRRQQEEQGNEDGPAKSLKEEEYEALMIGQAEASSEQDFVCVPSAEVGQISADWLDRIMLVKRLREVRALQSFARLKPWTAGDPEERRAPLFRTNPGWLPAIEVSGEGVFLKLKESLLSSWEALPDVRNRALQINENYVKRCRAYGTEPARVITPRFILLHSLAHVLINQWSLDCGYPAASLRERIYCSDEMAGILLYTATSDSAGSLGGVIAQGQGRLLDASMVEGLTRASWCSADPLCIESSASGADALNLAACHACSLLPEVSCEEMNCFLDRALLVGTPEAPEIGFFRRLLETL